MDHVDDSQHTPHTARTHTASSNRIYFSQTLGISFFALNKFYARKSRIQNIASYTQQSKQKNQRDKQKRKHQAKQHNTLAIHMRTTAEQQYESKIRQSPKYFFF